MQDLLKSVQFWHTICRIALISGNAKQKSGVKEGGGSQLTSRKKSVFTGKSKKNSDWRFKLQKKHRLLYWWLADSGIQDECGITDIRSIELNLDLTKF